MHRLISIALVGGLVPVLLLGQDRQQPSNLHSNLQHARQCANWLDSVAVTEHEATFWPVVPDDSKDALVTLYSGVSGVILFYLELFHATAEESYLETAVRGGDWLIANGLDFNDDTDASFYTGVAGIGWVFDQLYKATKHKRFAKAGQSCFEFVCKGATTSDNEGRNSARWNEVTDIVGGTAGIGFYLLQCVPFESRDQSLVLAMAAGDGLLELAKPVRSTTGDKLEGYRWMMSPNFPREMPNYSHGTAGICDFLIALDKICCDHPVGATKYDGRFLTAAKKGAAYLGELALDPSNHGLIPHNFPDGKELYYLGWCHGPTGTVGFFDRLCSDTHDERWQAVSDKLTASMLHSKIPETHPEGFWNNAGLCCGNAGAASFLLDRYETTHDKRLLALSETLTKDILENATSVQLPDKEKGLKWVHAEHRVRPSFLRAQTGLMQGASGIGILFIKRHQLANGKSLSTDLPFLPF